MPQVTNPNNAQASQWAAFFQGFPDLMFKLRAFTLPTISGGVTELGGSGNISLIVPGDHLQYDELQLDFIVDSDYKNYRKILAWLKFNARNPEPHYSDLTIHLLNNQGEFQGVSFNYTDAFPLLLGPIPLDTENETTDLMASISIKYTDIEILDKDGNEEVFQFVPK